MNKNKIMVLDTATANKIAAGEVVERPASIVKELIENSIDAQCNRIEIEIKNGGTTYIRVSDNGSGMSADDAKLAILRHATSKIRKVEDLYSISSMGFRGEALPSIAAVSRLSLVTRQEDTQLAVCIQTEGGELHKISEQGAEVGTTITVSDLFYNTPARKKFLKSINTESGQISLIIGKLALAYNNVAFNLINNGRFTLSTSGSGNLLDAVAALYGIDTADEMLVVNYEQDGIKINGFVGKPAVLKSSRQWQTLIVNGRIINNRAISRAIDDAYHSLLPKTGYPLAVLDIKILPEKIDINVHPQKSEIKFDNEQIVFRAVYRAITLALSGANRASDFAAPAKNAVNFEGINTDNLPSKSVVSERITQYSPAMSQARQEVADSWRKQEPLIPFNVVRELLEQQEPLKPNEQGELHLNDAVAVEEIVQAEKPVKDNLELYPLGQINECYIIAQGGTDLFIIDQHAAHERILYDRFCKRAGEIPIQQLLIPLLLDVDEDDMQFIVDNISLWHELGFTLEQAGPGLIRVMEIPVDMLQSETGDYIREIVSSLRNIRQPSHDGLRHEMFQLAACRAAIKAGTELNMRQMQSLLAELTATERPSACPHGRPAIVCFASTDLAKMFKRR